MRVGGRRPPLAPDAEVIRALAGLLAETGLTEIEYAVGDHRIRVAREAVTGAPQPVNGYTNGHAHPPTAVAAPEASPPDEASNQNALDHPGLLTSPMVGVAYLSPQPGAAPFVRVGDRVTEGQTLLIIEAMKVMNQIRAARAGRITRILVDDADPVEYGAPLLVIE